MIYHLKVFLFNIDCNLSDIEFRYLWNNLSKAKNLRRFDISNNKITSEGLVTICNSNSNVKISSLIIGSI